MSNLLQFKVSSQFMYRNLMQVKKLDMEKYKKYRFSEAVT